MNLEDLQKLHPDKVIVVERAEAKSPIPLSIWVSLAGLGLTILLSSLTGATKMGGLQERVRTLENISNERKAYVEQVRQQAIEIGVLKSELSHMKKQLDGIQTGLDKLLRRRD